MNKPNETKSRVLEKRNSTNLKLNQMKPDDIKYLVTSHQLNQFGRQKVIDINRATIFFIEMLAKNCPSGADSQIALRKIREAKFWATSSIAMDQSNQENKNVQS